MLKRLVVAAAAAAWVAAAQKPLPTGILGFNSGAFQVDYSAKTEADFEAEFTTAQNLRGSPGKFNSVRLYTNIQSGTQDTPLSAFQAAIKTKTTMLLGVWCSETTSIARELSALRKAIDQYGKPFADLVVGISVGSEDLYRISESGVRNKAGVGAGPSTILAFIKDTRTALKGTLLDGIPVGHVETWSDWTNTSNKAVLDEVDFVGVDIYPYYEDTGNAQDNLTNVFNEGYEAAKSAAKAAGKPVWITETGYPASGPTWGLAEASVENAARYWRDVGCTLFGRTNVWWYTLRDSNPANKPKFAITDNLSTTPKFDLKCPEEKGAPAPQEGGEGGTGGGKPNAARKPRAAAVFVGLVAVAAAAALC